MNDFFRKIKDFSGTKAGKIILTALSVIPALAAIGIALYYIWGPAEGFFHSDCTDNLLWANATLESGKVFDEDFRYAGLMPFSSTVWMIPLVAVFGVSMTAQNLGMSIFALLFAFSVWFVCRSAKMGTGWSSAAVFTVVLFSSSSDKLREIMYGHTIYYSLSLPIMCFCIGFAFRAIEAFADKKPVRAWIWLCAMAAMCAGTATDGGQVIVIGSLPAIAGIFAERFFCGEDKLFSQRSCNAWLSCIAGAAGTVIGIMLLNRWKGDSIDCAYANAYSGWSDISKWSENALLFPKQWFSLIGAESGKDTLFSLESIGTIIRIACGAAILVVPLVMLCFYKKLSSPVVKMTLWGHLVISAAVMFGFICGKLAGSNWRLTPIVCSAALVSLMGARELCLAGTSARKADKASIGQETVCTADSDGSTADSRVLIRSGAILLFVLLLLPLMVFFEIKKMPADYGRDNYNHVNAAFLESHGLEYGFATFWNSQTITAISDSHVKCREVYPISASTGISSDHYQSSKNWYVNQNYDKYFILLNDSEYNTAAQSKRWNEWTDKYLLESYDEEDGLYPGYHVFVFSENVIEFTEKK